MSIKFEATPVHCIFSAENYKIYACDIDRHKFPDVKLNNYYNVTISGDCGDLSLGMLYDIEADEKQSKYGYDYRIKYIKQQKPMSTEGLKQFLYACDLSYSQAEEIIREYPNIIDIVMQDRTNEIDTNKLYNIGKYRIEVIINKIRSNFMLADIVESLGGYFSFTIIKKLFDYYGSTDKIIKSLEQKPYECLCQINRVGFKTADKTLLALEKQINKDIEEGKEPPFKFNNELSISKDRCLSALTWLLDENEVDGNTILNIRAVGTALKNLVPECFNHFVDICKNANDDEELNKQIYVNLEHKWIANVRTHIKEVMCAVIISNALNNPIKWNIDIEKYRCNDNIKLTDEQLNTLQMVCDSNISVLSGYAGSGKSASTVSLIQMLKDNNKSFMLLAPTGRASKVLSEYTKCPAQTIHKLLYSMDAMESMGDENPKIYVDMVIVDEVSMCDISLFYNLIHRIDFTKTKLLLVGDEAQLPSVGAGNVLYDIVHSDKVPVNRLTKIFRYGNNSILTVATDIRNSQSYLKKDLGDKKYMFVETPQETMVNKVKALYKKLIDAGFPKEDILILSAYNKGNYGTTAINNVLQSIVNKNVNNTDKSLKMGKDDEAITFAIDDMVIQTKNNYKANLCDDNYKVIEGYNGKPKETFIPNGEIGIIKNIDKNIVYIKFNDEMVLYDKTDMVNVKLAYSISIHKSQGGSAKVIILLTPKAHTYMLSSNLLYVGVTRAKDKVIHFGTSPTVNSAIKKKADLSRHTWFKEYIIDYYDNFTNKQNNIKEDNNE
jgi:exodeoxyribonuclease V alpha subunit